MTLLTRCFTGRDVFHLKARMFFIATTYRYLFHSFSLSLYPSFSFFSLHFYARVRFRAFLCMYFCDGFVSTLLRFIFCTCRCMGLKIEIETKNFDEFAAFAEIQSQSLMVFDPWRSAHRDSVLLLLATAITAAAAAVIAVAAFFPQNIFSKCMQYECEHAIPLMRQQQSFYGKSFHKIHVFDVRVQFKPYLLEQQQKKKSRIRAYLQRTSNHINMQTNTPKM